MHEHENGTKKDERDCSAAEYWIRSVISSLFYFRLYRRLHPDSPFYAPAAIRRIEDLLDDHSKVFEWGSGVSTLWYARRVAKIVSVEHDEEWYRRGLSTLKENGLRNVDLFLEPPADNHPSSWEKEWPHFRLLGHPPAKPKFYNYMRRIDEYPDAFFDCVAIDG
jgi:hypothetical protein